MAVAVELPKLGLRTPPTLIAEWYLPDGANVHHGEPICRLETDGVAIELEAEGEGVLRHRIEAGSSQGAGETLGLILAAGERMPEMPPVEEQPSAEVPLELHHGPSEREWVESAQAMRYWPSEAGGARREEVAVATPARHGFEIVPFPARSSAPEPEPEPEQGSAWDPAPGDAVDFASALFETATDTESPDEAGVAAPPLNDFPTARLPRESDEVTEPEDLSADWLAAEDQSGGGGRSEEEAGAVRLPDDPATRLPETAELQAGEEQVDEGVHRVVAFPAPGLHARQLWMRAAVDLTEAHKLRAQLGREWREAMLMPGNEDVVVRAAGRALVEAGTEGTVALRRFEEGEERVARVDAAGVVPFREAVAAARQAAPATSNAACVVTAFDDVDEATTALGPDTVFALGVGGERTTVRWDGDRAAPAPILTLTLSYDAGRVSPFEAERFLSRVRDLVEAPYALLVA